MSKKLVICAIAALTVMAFKTYGQDEKTKTLNYKTEGKDKLDQGDYINAIVAFDKYLQQNPNDFEALYLMAKAKSELKPKGVKNSITKEWEIDVPNEVKKTIKDKAWYKTDIERVPELCNIAISTNIKDEKAYFYRALSQLELYPYIGEDLGKCGFANESERAQLKSIKQEVTTDLDKVIQLNPKNAEAYYNRSRVWQDGVDETTNINNEISYIDKAIAINSAYADAYNRRAWLKWELAYNESKGFSMVTENTKNELKSAIENMSIYIKLRPKDWIAYQDKASYEEESEDYEGAIADLEKAKELSPDEPVEYDLPWDPPEGLKRHKCYERDIAKLKAKLAGKDNKK